MYLISGYWRIPIKEEDQQKCSIITSDGLYQPTRMPQNLSNAPSTFQRLICVIFRYLKSICVLVYLDNIKVYSKSFKNHLEDLEKVFFYNTIQRPKNKTKEMFLFKRSTRISRTHS